MDRAQDRGVGDALAWRGHTGISMGAILMPYGGDILAWRGHTGLKYVGDILVWSVPEIEESETPWYVKEYGSHTGSHLKG